MQHASAISSPKDEDGCLKSLAKHAMAKTLFWVAIRYNILLPSEAVSQPENKNDLQNVYFNSQRLDKINFSS